MPPELESPGGIPYAVAVRVNATQPVLVAVQSKCGTKFTVAITSAETAPPFTADTPNTTGVEVIDGGAVNVTEVPLSRNATDGPDTCRH